MLSAARTLLRNNTLRGSDPENDAKVDKVHQERPSKGLIQGCVGKRPPPHHIRVHLGNPNQKPYSTLKLTEESIRKCSGNTVWREGDWVEFHLENTCKDDEAHPTRDSAFVDVSYIAALNSKIIRGKVINLDKYCLVDDGNYKTLIPRNLGGKGLADGTVVQCTVIESKQKIGEHGWASWRAIKVEEIKFSSDTCPDAEEDGERMIEDFDIVSCHKALLQDKYGIEIIPNRIRFPTLTTGASATMQIKIKNTNIYVVYLLSITCHQDETVCKFNFQPEQAEKDFYLPILPKDEVALEMTCQPFLIGRTTELCIFNFDTCQIGRLATVVTKSEIEMQLETKDMDKDHAVRKPVDISKIIMDNERQMIKSSHTLRPPFFRKKQLPEYVVPEELWIAYKDNNNEYLRQLYPTALYLLSYQNYKEKFKLNLWLEEIENQKQRREYDLTGVVLRKCKDGYVFTAPGIQEFQPPVNISDIIDVFDSKNASGKKFEGKIQNIFENQVTCIFGDKFDQDYTGYPLTVQFRLSRTPYKRCHFAVDNAKVLGESFLFPTIVDMKPPRLLVGIKDGFNNCEEDESCTNPKLQWFNKKLNEEQRNAVCRILRGQARPLPYVVFGPPGTGKTVTLVEAIVQINKHVKNSRVLVCTSSNAAADIIAEHLAKSNKYNPGDFLRINAFSRSVHAIPESIKRFCSNGGDLLYDVMRKIIISTCSMAGEFSSLDLGVGHFTHVFIDEAGYSTEPDTLMAAVLLGLFKEGQLILAGDPKQLGPVLRSLAVQTPSCGLHVTFLERLMATPLYRRDVTGNYNPLVLTKLVKNYRSHPTLLKLPSQMFYDDELEPAANFEEVDQLCQNVNVRQALESKTLGVPMYFWGALGDSLREEGSHSWYNMAEAAQVTKFVVALMNECRLSCDDIGIITPYKEQVEKIRHCLKIRLMHDNLPKVASVQAFQGGERKVIIISTVRSVREDKVDKCKDQMTFIYQPTLFNVAITRAKSLMIVVGDPHVLSQSECWVNLLRHCIELKSYGGCNLPVSICPKTKDFLRKPRKVIVSLAKGKNEEKHYDEYDDYEEPTGF